jgi:hypothetical protein
MAAVQQLTAQHAALCGVQHSSEQRFSSHGCCWSQHGVF